MGRRNARNVEVPSLYPEESCCVALIVRWEMLLFFSEVGVSSMRVEGVGSGVWWVSSSIRWGKGGRKQWDREAFMIRVRGSESYDDVWE